MDRGFNLRIPFPRSELMLKSTTQIVQNMLKLGKQNVIAVQVRHLLYRRGPRTLRPGI